MDSSNLVGKKVKLHISKITSPNAIGIITKETPKTLTVKVIKRTFEKKVNKSFPNFKWTKAQKEWWKDYVGFELKFWKDTMLEFGSSKNWNSWSINHIID